MNEPSAALASAIEGNRREPDRDKVERLQAMASRVRDIDREIEDAEEQIKRLKGERKRVVERDMVDLFDEVGVDRIGLPASGNLPAADVQVGPYFFASIASDWPEERRKEAFDLLESREAGDLIRTTVTLSFGKGELSKALEFARVTMETFGYRPDVKKAVPWASLTAWVRELYQVRHSSLSADELEKLGAHVGRVATLKPRKS